MVEGYEKHLYPHHTQELDNRVQIGQVDYETQFEYKIPVDGSAHIIESDNDSGPFVLEKVENHIRHYKKL